MKINIKKEENNKFMVPSNFYLKVKTLRNVYLSMNLGNKNTIEEKSG